MNLLTTITRHYGLCLALTLGLSQSALAGTEAKTGSSGKAAVFSHFVYQGQDAVYQQHPLKEGEVYSPILQGCYPDPSICRKGNDYYLVNSSFAMFPGVPIFHSTDLRNWEQIGHVLDRESQLKVWDCGISAGIYAPTIRYCKANDTFYMITTEFAGGFGNIVVKTKDPMKGWSDPIKLNFDGIILVFSSMRTERPTSCTMTHQSIHSMKVIAASRSGIMIWLPIRSFPEPTV